MIIDPTALFALALCIGILGLLVLILPLMLLFWSQMEPQLVELIGGDGSFQDDEYASHAVLPGLMKSFNDLAEQSKRAKPAGTRRAAAAAKSKPKTTAKPKAPAKSKAAAKPAAKSGTARKAGTGSRSKASSTKRTVKPAPSKKAGSSKAAKSAPKTKAVAAKGKSATTGSAAKSKASSAGAKSKATKSARRTPAGAKRDPILGVIYTKKPKEIDDLKGIKGVAKVIEGKLHEAGIYTFRQIVEWDDSMIDAFSEKLSFKGRVRNEGWQKQCAAFHLEKYGEKIG